MFNLTGRLGASASWTFQEQGSMKRTAVECFVASSTEDEPSSKRLKRSASVDSLVQALAKTMSHPVTPPTPVLDYAFTQEVFIPEDILLFLFGLLSRQHLVPMKSVCRYWQKVASHPSLAWKTVHELQCRSGGFAYADRNSFETSAQELKKKNLPLVVRFKTPTDPTAYPLYQGKWCTFSSKDQTIQFPHVLVDSMYAHEPFFSSCTDETQALFDQLFEFSLVNQGHWYVRISVNTHSLETFTIQGIHKDLIKAAYSVLVHAFSKIEHNPVLNLPSKEAFFPPIESLDTDFDLTDKIKLPLFKYQKDAVAWMKSVENSPDPEFKYLNSLSWPIFRPDIVWSPDLSPVAVFSDQILDCVEKVNFRGAVLADEMGLGKTLEVLALISHNPKVESPTFKPDTLLYCPDQQHLFETKTTLVICPNHLVKQWKDELEKHSNKISVKTLATIREYKQLSFQDLIRSDVLIISFQFLQNGNYLFFETGVLPSSGMRDLHRAVKHGVEELLPKKGPLLEAFLFHRIVLDEGHEVVTNELFQLSVSLLCRSFSWYITGTPFPNEETVTGILQFFRVTTTPAINLFPTEPFSHYHNTEETVKKTVGDTFLQNRIFVISEILIANLFWRNTKASVTTEFSIPSFTEEVIVLDFHPVEQAFYLDAKIRGDEERQRQLSNSPHLSKKERKLFGDGPITLEQMRVKMISHLVKKPPVLAKKVGNAQAMIVQLEKDISQLQSDLNEDVETDGELSEDEEIRKKKQDQGLEGLDDDENVDSEPSSEDLTDEQKEERKQKKIRRKKLRQLRGKKRALRKTKALLVSLQNKIIWNKESTGVFQALKPDTTYRKPIAAPKIKQKDQPIDFKAFKSQKVDAIVRELKKRGLDTKGTKPVLLKRLEDEAKRQKEAKNSEWKDEIESHLVQLHGTKLAATVQFLKRLLYKPKDTTKKAKILIFSQFSQFLHQVAAFLKENGIDNVFIEGNVTRREQAIKEFKQGEAQVMMLSLDHAASGTNLTEATHVILLDPIQGTIEESRAIEDQAIGRAFRQGQKESVVVVRFLIKSTLEHEQYLQRKQSPSPKKKLVRASGSTLIANLSGLNDAMLQG